MSGKKTFLLQGVVWMGIWAVFALGGNMSNMQPGIYLALAVRICWQAIYFNVCYYILLPIYFNGEKRRFWIGAALAFLVFVVCAVGLDSMVKAPLPPNGMPSKPPLPMRWFPPTFFGLTLFGIAAAFRGISAFEQKKRDEETADRRRLEAELALLKSQINPHFLLNTLNNLYGIALAEPDKTPDALLKLSEMVRYLLYECAQECVPLARDLGFIQHYIALQEIRLPDNVNLQVHFPEQETELEIVPMMLIPFVENAFKHGLSTNQTCTIIIDIQLEGTKIWLEVLNQVFTYKKITGEDEYGGIGLSNTIRRLEYQYPDKFTLRRNEEGGFHRIQLEIDLA